MDYHFKSIFYKQELLLSDFCLSESQLYKWVADWQTQGNDVALMGQLPKCYARSRVWDPRVFLKWLEANKINRPIQFNYEKAEQDNIKKALVVNFNNQRRKII